MKTLKVIKIYYKAGRIIRQLHKHQTTSTKIKENEREAVFRKGAKKACNLLPLVFNIYIEKAINEYKGYCTGIKLNGTRIQMLKFADYIAIVAQDELNQKKKNYEA